MLIPLDRNEYYAIMLYVVLFDSKQQKEGITIQNKSIGIELRSLSNIIMRYMENNSNKKLVDSITGTNGWIIGYIAKNNQRDVFQKDLEEEFSITRSTASKVVNLMVKKGLIEHQNVLYDARLKKLVLTPKAVELSRLMKEDFIKLESKLKQGFSSEELIVLFSLIDRMKQNLK